MHALPENQVYEVPFIVQEDPPYENELKGSDGFVIWRPSYFPLDDMMKILCDLLLGIAQACIW